MKKKYGGRRILASGTKCRISDECPSKSAHECIDDRRNTPATMMPSTDGRTGDVLEAESTGTVAQVDRPLQSPLALSLSFDGVSTIVVCYDFRRRTQRNITHTAAIDFCQLSISNVRLFDLTNGNYDRHDSTVRFNVIVQKSPEVVLVSLVYPFQNQQRRCSIKSALSLAISFLTR